MTGASRGFGSHIAGAFARAGYAIVLHGRDENRLRAGQEQILRTANSACAVVLADLESTEGLNVVKMALQRNNVDLLVNNAAVDPELTTSKPVREIREVTQVFSVNASSTIALCYAAFDHFKARGGGMIVNINSVAGLRGSSHEPVYAASKFGLRGFSESVKEEWLKEGVRVMDVYSGAMATGMSSQRPDACNLIDAKELAELLVGLCSTRSFFLRELSVRRSIYPKEGKQ